jgi:glutathione synthase/RimK-type ligase-like ATP-grasp enzyme
MILVEGIPSDPPLAAVEAELSRRGVPSLFLDQRAAPQTTLRMEVGDRVNGALTVFEETVRLEDIRAVYPRPHELTQLASAAQEVRPGHAAALYAAMLVWLDVTPAFVLNRPVAMALNASKPYQAALIEAVGLRTPPTLLTTDPDAATSFRDRHGTVIYKSISAMRSIVARLGADDVTRLQNVTWCPTQFQRRIGGFEVRVHVMGDAIFASRIISDADDYRYAALTGHDMDIVSFELPPEVAALCRKVTAALGYVIAGLDLRCEDGAWYCFEANPSPGFTYYEQRTGQPIAAAVADLLAGALTSRKNLVAVPSH